LEITGHGADVAQNVYTPDVPVGLLEHIAPGAAAAIARAIDEWTEFHHPFPKFMGGPLRQDLEALKAWRHRLFHADLASALREAVPFPSAAAPAVGTNGSNTLRSFPRPKTRRSRSSGESQPNSIARTAARLRLSWKRR